MLHRVLEGVQTVRTHSLDRSFKIIKPVGGLKRKISVNMAWDGAKLNGTNEMGRDETGRDWMEGDGMKPDGWDGVRWDE